MEMNKMKKWRSLSTSQRRLLLFLAVFIPLINFKIRTSGLDRTLSWLKSKSLEKSNKYYSTAKSNESIDDIISLVNIGSRYTCFQVTCLRRSVILWWLLYRKGYSATIQIGSMMCESEFHSHAWVMLNGEVLNDSPEVVSKYSQLVVTVGQN
jgi:hypothetical protein